MEPHGRKQPEPLECLQFFQGAQILDLVEGKIQVQQVRKVFQRSDISDLVVEKFRIFKVLQGSKGCDIRHIVAADDQHPQLRQVIQEIQAVDLVMPDVQAFQVPAVFQHGEILAAVLGAPVVVQCGEGGIVRADQVFVIPSLDDHRPAPLDVRIAGSKCIALLFGHPVFPHIHPFQVGKLIQNSIKRLEILDNVITQIHPFRILGPFLSRIGYICTGQDRAEKEDQQDNPQPFAFHRSHSSQDHQIIIFSDYIITRTGNKRKGE